MVWEDWSGGSTGPAADLLAGMFERGLTCAAIAEILNVVMGAVQDRGIAVRRVPRPINIPASSNAAGSRERLVII
jgi:hypothetical protein